VPVPRGLDLGQRAGIDVAGEIDADDFGAEGVVQGSELQCHRVTFASGNGLNAENDTANGRLSCNSARTRTETGYR
jgi:hypothetical protein